MNNASLKAIRTLADLKKQKSLPVIRFRIKLIIKIKNIGQLLTMKKVICFNELSKKIYKAHSKNK